MGALPKTKEALQDAGYLFDGEGYCKACGAPIEWYITPNDKKMPMDVIAKTKDPTLFSPVTEFIRQPHWASCPNAKDFRNGKHH